MDDEAGAQCGEVFSLRTPVLPSNGGAGRFLINLFGGYRVVIRDGPTRAHGRKRPMPRSTPRLACRGRSVARSDAHERRASSREDSLELRAQRPTGGFAFDVVRACRGVDLRLQRVAGALSSRSGTACRLLSMRWD